MKPLDVNINNKKIIQKLDELKTEFFRLKDNYGLEMAADGRFNGAYSDNRVLKEPLYYLSKEYLNFMQAKQPGKDLGKHMGPPEAYYAYPVSRLGRLNDEWALYQQKVKNDLATYFGASKSSLASYYPSGGLVGWHTNWNNPGYQILLTWSETGDSFFTYQDIKTKEIVKIHERPGWQAHLVEFGGVGSNKVLWHAAYTNCERFAWAPTWDVKGKTEVEAEMIKEMVMDVVDELQAIDN